MKKCIMAMGLLSVAYAASGGEVSWVGLAVENGVGCWTNAANWADGKVPGRYIGLQGDEQGEVGSCVVFPVGTDDLTINLDGLLSVGSVRITDGGAGVLTLGTERTQSLRIESEGCLAVDGTVVTSPRLVAGLGSYSHKGESADKQVFAVSNDSLSATLRLSDIGDAKILGGEPSWVSRTYGFSGRGAIRVDGEIRNLGGLIMPLYCAKFIVGATHLKAHSLELRGGNVAQTIEICEGGKLGVGARSGYGIVHDSAGGVVDITGGGELQICGGEDANGVWMNGVQTFGGSSEVTISCAVFSGIDQSNGTMPVGLRTRGSGTVHPSWAAGTVNLRSPDCRLDGIVEMYNATWARVSSLGLNGAGGSFGYCTNFYLMNNARIIYTGSGERTDRKFHIGRHESVKITNSNAAPSAGNAAFELEQAGTGPLVVDSSLDYTESTEGVSPKIVLLNETKWPATWAGNLAVEGLSIEKRGSGLWTLSGENSNVDEMRISGGTLRIASVDSFSGSKIVLSNGRLELPAKGADESNVIALPHTTVSGDSSLFVGGGQSVTIQSLDVAAGKTLSIETDDDIATVKVIGAAEGDATGITLNGYQARFNENGEIVSHVTAWKSTGSGSWRDSANWSDGVPTIISTARIAPASDTIVSISDAASVSNLHVRSSQGQATLSVAAALTVPANGAIRIEKGGKIAFEDSGSATFSGGASLEVEDGGTLSIDGGTLAMAGTPLSGSGRIEMTAGELCLTHTGWNGTSASLTGSQTHLFSGSARLYDDSSAVGKFLCDGTLDFRGNAALGRKVANQNVFMSFSPATADGVCSLSFSESAFIDAANVPLILGCPTNSLDVSTPTTLLTLDSDADSKVLGIWAGVERSNCTQVEIKSGRVDIGNFGIRLGGSWEGYWVKGSMARGVMNVFGGVVTVGGFAYAGYYRDLTGFCVGECLVDTSNVGRNFRFSGRFELNGGAVTNTCGFFCVGGGLADGEFIQNGGSFCQSNTDDARRYPCPQIVGAFSGDGLLAVSNGVVRFETGEDMYVGGISASDIRKAGRFPMASDPSKVLPGLIDVPLAAKGKVEVVDGSLVSSGGIVLGADGRGEISLVGPRGEARFASLVMSNNVESVVRFVFDEGGVKPLKIDGNLTITDGARLEVDLGAYTGGAKPFRLIDCAERIGAFQEDHITISGAEGRYAGASVVYTGRGMRLSIPCGTVITLR